MRQNKEIKESLLDGFSHFLNEATSVSTVGSYRQPLVPGLRKWKNEPLKPFTNKVTPFTNPELDFDVMDGHVGVSKQTAKSMENKSKKQSHHVSKINSNEFISDSVNRILNKLLLEKQKESEMSEDLGVWFGTKKKPKGSSQPKGPWVNICRKVNGKHPPCGRPDTSKGAYPKCRAAGVAGKMSDSQKKAACQQKRKAEKKDTQTGKGQKPVMTSYKPKKKN